jgi:phage terminase small subunit
MEEKPLTDKEALFVAAYLGEAKCNGTEAARVAGFGGTSGALAVTAYRLLRNANVRSAIDTRLEEVKARIGPERVYQFYADLLDSDITDLFTISEKGRPKLNLNGAKEAGRLGLIKSVTIGKDSVKVEGYCKDAAVAAITKLHGLNAPEKTELTGKDGGPIETVRTEIVRANGQHTDG